MKVALKQLNNAYHFEAVNQDGNTVQMDAAPSIGGENKGVRPMQMLLMALGGCSGIDIVLILKRQRQEVEDISMEIEGDRQEGHEPNLFEKIKVHFKIDGAALNRAKVERAVSLSMDKYCSVAKTLEKTATIDYTITLNGEQL